MKLKTLIPFTLVLSLPLLISGPITAENSEGSSVSPSEKIVKTILAKGYKRIAVLPRVVARTSAEENQVVGKNTVGALSMAWPDELYDALIEASVNSNGKFSVVSDQQVLQALKGKTVDDVGSEDMWQVIRDKTGADFLASIDVTDPGAVEGKTGSPEVKRVVNGVDLKDNSAVGRITQVYNKSLSDGAYAGESFVVREWQGNKLVATGLSGKNEFTIGSAAEKEQYADLVPQEHPLLRSDYPYGIAVEVNGQIREPKILDGQLVVPLDLGEEYVVRVWNKGEREVFMGLYVDGVNTIGGELERPDNTPTNRNWFLKPDQSSKKIAGWQKIDPETKEATYEKFVIVDAENAVAKEASQPGGEGFGDNLGMITAVVYSYGMDDIPATKAVASIASDNIGTGRGAKESGGVAGYDPNAKQKGLLLGTMTIFYRSKKWFDEHPDGKAKSEVAEAPKPDPQLSEDPLKTTETQPEPEPEVKKDPPVDPKDSENDLPE